jgi:hypothetical protein
MNDATFPSGQWVGFYTYAAGSRRYLMDLILEFRNGVISGEGADGIGFFVIAGHYCAQGGECGWSKTYIGRHSVDYAGFREKKGIWGTWTIAGTRGGFHIWPIGEGGFGEKLREEAGEEVSIRNQRGTLPRLAHFRPPPARRPPPRRTVRTQRGGAATKRSSAPRCRTLNFQLSNLNIQSIDLRSARGF